MGGIWERYIRTAGTIFDALLKTHSCSLNDENFRALLAEAEGIINSRPFTEETLSDVNSHIPLLPSNLLTQKTNAILPPPGSFDRPDLYSRRRWRRIKHIAGGFWSRWRNEFLQILQIQQKCNTEKRNFEVGDMVLLKEDLDRNKWPMARVVKIEPDSNGAARTVELRTVDSLNNQNLLRRPVNKITLLVENEMARFPTKRTNKGQDDMITWGEPYVEALRKRLPVKINLWNGETVYVTFCKFSICGCDLFNCIVIRLVTYAVCMCLNRSCT